MAYAGLPIVAAVILVQLALDPLQKGLADAWAWPGVGIGIWCGAAWLRQRAELEGRREAAREEHTRAVLAEERLHVSRELHDILAHSVSVMVLQAEAAEEMLSQHPGSAYRPLRRIQETGRESLQEIRRLLAEQRGAEDDDVGSWTDVADSLEAVVDRVRTAGLPVGLDSCDLSDLSPHVGRAVVRITQEALTNVLRHAGPVPTSVTLRRSHGRLALCVDNDGGTSSGLATAGFGLVGMRERVASCGGSLRAGPRPQGGYRVTAEFPLTVRQPA